MTNLKGAERNYYHTIEFDSGIYNKNALLYAAQKFTNIFILQIEEDRENNINKIYFKIKDDINNEELIKYKNEIINEVLDMQVRIELEKENSYIRKLIVQQAFKPIKNLNELLDSYE